MDEAHARLATDVDRAAERIAGIVRTTPLEASPLISRKLGGRVLLKLEHLQHTGSFKLRGAASKLTAHREAALTRGVITASTGNHGLAVTHAARAIGAAAPTVFVPQSADAGKVERLRAMGADVVVAGAGCVDAEAAAQTRAREQGRVYVSPYNDLDVIAGQGTVGREIAEADASIDEVFVAVGGGGLVAGIAAAVKSRLPRARIVGCLPESSAGMVASIRAGKIVEAPELPTFSDATAGGLEPDSITFTLCRDLVDDWITVSEDAIRNAWQLLFASDRWAVEGAAAVPLAAAMTRGPANASSTRVIVLCGRNVSAKQLAALLP